MIERDIGVFACLTYNQVLCSDLDQSKKEMVA